MYVYVWEGWFDRDCIVVRAGDVSELINFDRTFLDNTNEMTMNSFGSKKVSFSNLPKYVNK